MYFPAYSESIFSSTMYFTRGPLNICYSADLAQLLLELLVQLLTPQPLRDVPAPEEDYIKEYIYSLKRCFLSCNV
jgi:hypothetical protein